MDGHEHVVHVFARIMEGRTPEQRGALAEAVVRSLTALLPTVGIISVNVSEFERATYRDRSMLGQLPEEGASAAVAATERV